MALYENSRPMVDGHRLLGARHGNFVARIAGALADWNDRRLTRNALSRLTDRELDDIGLNRGDIDVIKR